MSENFRFKKSLGQNFLKDNNVVRKIIKESSVDFDTLVIEIGPGAGALSKELAKVCGQLLCYEIDERLKSDLEKISKKDNVKIKFIDFLETNLNDDIKSYNYKKICVVANIPYYITTPIIQKLIDSKIDFDKIILMVQDEVGNRLTSKANSKYYNSLSVYINYHFVPKKLFVVKKDCFVPKPKVDSCIIELSKRKEKIKVLNEDVFFKLVRDSFVHKRKNLRNNLYNYNLKKIEEVLEKYNFDLTARAEELSIEIFADIANNL